MATNELVLPPVTVEDLLRMIGDKEVTIARQATVIASQAARLAELEEKPEVVKELEEREGTQEAEVVT